MRFNGDSIAELSRKYQLQGWIIKDEIERTVSHILTKRLGSEVGVMFDGSPDSFEIWGFGDTWVKEIPLSHIRPSIKNEIKHAISCALLKRSVLEEYEQIKDKLGEVIYGTIINISPYGEVFVEIQDVFNQRYDKVVAVCDLSSQTPKERGHYRIGETFPFYIQNIKPIYEGDIPQLKIRLSRNSKGLVEGLIKKEFIDSHIDTEVQCIKRIAGAYSEIKSLKRISKEYIKKVSDELKERIIVRW